MMLVDPKSIIKRLTRACTTALEGGVVQCVNARHYEVTLEHVMLALLDNADSDLAFLVSSMISIPLASSKRFSGA